MLNGDLQTVISLYDYAAITGDAQALAWARDGAQAAAAAAAEVRHRRVVALPGVAERPISATTI